MIRTKAKRTGRLRGRPTLEPLERRELLTGGDSFHLSGLQWSVPSHITYSVAPDGVFWDHASNSLSQSLDAKLGAGVWERELARALQTWASVSNINIVKAGDARFPLDAPGQSQGDPRFGDIRIGGYSFGNQTTLAQTYSPPPDGLTAAGDTEINTSIDWEIGSGVDLYSVMLHEFGHSLGLDHTQDAQAVMNPVYGGLRSGLTPLDIAGVQAMYGPRVPDSYRQQGQGGSAANAIDTTSGLGSTLQENLSGFSLSTIGDTEYFSVTAPVNVPAGSSLAVVAIAENVSLLSPKVTVYDAQQRVEGTNADPSSWGDNVGVEVRQAVPGQRYTIAVTGATQDVFATGAYQLRVAFVNPGAAAPPPTSVQTPPPPSASHSPAAPIPTSAPTIGPVASPIAPDRFDPNNTLATAANLGRVASATVGNLSIDAPSNVDFFAFQTARSGIYRISAPGTTLRIFDGQGRQFGQGNDLILFRSPRAGKAFYVSASSTDGSTVESYGLSILTQANYTAIVRQARNRVKSHQRAQIMPLGANHSSPLLARSHPLGPQGRLPSRHH